MKDIFSTTPIFTAFSKKKDGSMKVINEDFQNRQNRIKFVASLGLGDKPLVTPKVQHGNAVVQVTVGNFKDEFVCDSLITNESGLILGVTAADCLSIYFYDPEHGAIGIAHAGWRGVVKNIASETVAAMTRAYGSAPSSLFIKFGPSICENHFEVKDDVYSLFFESYPEATIKTKEGKMFVDLKKVVRIQLARTGVKEENIEANKECTFELQEKYYSYRRDKPEVVQAMLGIIGLTD